jgi:ADP-ribose pyrophosphatase YjhB (NUDIX family)
LANTLSGQTSSVGLAQKSPSLGQNPNHMENFWLSVAQRAQALAQAGLTYSTNDYDLDRYHQLTDLAVEMLAKLSGGEPGQIKDLMTADVGYRTPKTDVRAVVLRAGQVLLVREREDGAWSLPGGWADIGLSPRENVEKEVWEESGLRVRATRLLAVIDKKMHQHPPSPNYVYKLFFHCEETGGQLAQGMETLGVGFFGLDALPPLSVDRNTEAQVRLAVQLAQQPGPVYFD